MITALPALCELWRAKPNTAHADFTITKSV